MLTIVTQKTGQTVFLNETIPQVHFMKLISCSLYIQLLRHAEE